MILKSVLVFILVLVENTISAPLQIQAASDGLSFMCFHVIKRGAPPPGSPVVLIHDFGSSKDDWRGTQQALAYGTGKNVCALDLRNHGGSTWNNEATFESMLSDVEKFMHSRNIRRVNIIGHGVGGKIGVHYALKYPELVDSLVVEDMRPNDVPQEAIVVIQKVAQLLRPSIQSVPKGSTVEQARKIVADVINNKLKELGTEERIQDHVAKYLPIRCSQEKCAWETNIDFLEKITKNPESFMEKSSGLYEGPTLFIYGTKSPFKVQDDKKAILDLFPNAVLTPVEGAGHAIHGVYREFDTIVLNFIKQAQT